jgi:uncharacterized protein YhdP
MQDWLKKLARKLLMVVAGCVIALALALGACRLLLTQLPSYQAQLQQWVAAELGLTFEFAAVDARWGLRGPELTFHEASVAGSDAAEPFLFAGRAAITVDPLRFLLERELTVNTLTFDGTRVTIVPGADGTFRVQDAPVGGVLERELEMSIPPAVEVAVRDSEVHYIDESTQGSWQFSDLSANLSRTVERMTVELRATPPKALAERLELSVQGEIAVGASRPVTWRTFATLRAVDLASLAELAPALDMDGLEGSGDLSAWLDWSNGGPVRATGEVALAQVSLPNAASDEVYDRLAMRVEWSGRPASSWQLAFSDVVLSRNGGAWPAGGLTKIEVGRDGSALERVVVESDYLRVEDLRPFALAVPDTELAQRWRELEPSGELNELALRLERDDGAWEYDVSGRFAELAIAAGAGHPGFSGLSGEVRADARSGRVEFASGGLELDSE